MDNLRAFEEDVGFAPAADEPVIDAPPEIGVDERRMHVRAYNYWVSLLGGRSYPSIQDVQPHELDDFGPNSVLLDFTRGVEDPAVPFIGRALREECGLGSNIARISDVPPRSLLSRLTDHYLQIIANCAPIGFEAEFQNHHGLNTMYRGILMPLSSDGDTIDFIYGVINWKEVAGREVTAELARQVDRAARAPVVDAASVWADGPRSEFEEQGTALDLDDEAEDERFQPMLDLDAGLADRLFAARETAEAVKSADARSRAALYRALGQAYDFALAAESDPDDYAEILEDAGVKAQARAPMTPIVKLIFGADYDKGRLTEYAAALSYARRENVAAGALRPLLESFKGGLKAVVQAERQARRPDRAPAASGAAQDKLRRVPAIAYVDVPAEGEFVLLVARREADGRLAVLAPVTDEGLLDRALRRAA